MTGALAKKEVIHWRVPGTENPPEPLTGYVVTGALAKKEVIHWRVPGAENPPEPQDGEVVVFYAASGPRV